MRLQKRLFCTQCWCASYSGSLVAGGYHSPAGTDGGIHGPVQTKFEFHHGDYEKQFLHVLSRKDKTGIVNNPNQSVFLFIDRQHLQTPKNKATIFKLCSICLYLPQEQLTHCAVGTIEDHLSPYMPE
ncbi:Uncharacterized protein family C6orf62 containing protein [Cricetulus griseus]|uniref:Uncharacterized protein family C6orf62 containing protein n=1 Tax=Cricetulus griseus TaxID=10029 RepID=A0A061HUU7_CRIGR|nr:Uncharacterized protein family C6orf62 containing protein [Cricetulus griseus]